MSQTTPQPPQLDTNLTAQPLAQRLGSLQAALDLIDQGFTLINEDLTLVAWNKAFCRLLDFPDSLAYEGASFESFMRYNALRGEYGEGDPEAHVRKRVDAARTFQPHVLERVRPNGMVLRVQGVPVPGHGFVTLYSDVTQQRRSEQLIREQNSLLETRVVERTAALQRSEAQMRLITDSIPALVAYFDADLHYRYTNRGYQDWFGIDPAHPELVSAREFLGLETYRTIKPHIKKALQGEAVTFEYEVATINPNGTMPLLRLARTTLIPETNAQGDTRQVIGCFELTFDITEQRRAHEMLVQAQKMEALGQLTSGLSHDFNNILTVVLGNLSALSELPEVQRHRAEYITPAMEAARRGSELIRGLLSFSRQQPQQTSLVELGQLIANVDRLVRHTLPESLQLVFVPHDHETWCELDPHQFENALLNLILNARDATESRGHITVIKTHHRLSATQATPLHLKAGAYACISVSDNGCGMDAATRSRVFEPFFTTKLPGRGSGLGLSMVYGFARQSGGTVDIRSEPGIGTDMQIWLPLAASHTADEPLRTEDDIHPPLLFTQDDVPTERPKLALLVEDDADVRTIVRRQLLELGFVVLEADNGREALTIIEQTPHIQLVLSDFVMPGGVDGQAVTSHARQHQIPQVVLMSGHLPDIKPRSDDGQTSAMPVLAKPFTREQLAAVVSAPISLSPESA